MCEQTKFLVSQIMESYWMKGNDWSNNLLEQKKLSELALIVHLLEIYDDDDNQIC